MKKAILLSIAAASLLTTGLGFAAPQTSPFQDTLNIHLQGFKTIPVVTVNSSNGLHVRNNGPATQGIVSLFLSSSNLYESGSATITVRTDATHQCTLYISDGPWSYARYSRIPACSPGYHAGGISLGSNEASLTITAS